MGEQAALVDTQATTLDIEEARDARTSQQNASHNLLWAELRASVEPEVYDERLGWYRNRAVAHCADWLFSDDQFCQWLDPLQKTDTAAWLFLHGIPGAGKTYLATAAFDRIRETAETAVQGPCIVLFALVSHASKKGLTAVSVLKSLLFQAAEDDRNLQKRLFLKSRPDDLRGNLPHITDRLRGFFLERATPSDATKRPARAHIVIDGLDEMDKDEGLLLLRNLNELAWECPNLRVMISSRAEDDIAQELQRYNAAKIRVDDKNHSSIETYVDRRLRKWVTSKGISRENDKVIRRLLQRLPKIANGKQHMSVPFLPS